MQNYFKTGDVTGVVGFHFTKQTIVAVEPQTGLNEWVPSTTANTRILDKLKVQHADKTIIAVKSFNEIKKAQYPVGSTFTFDVYPAIGNNGKLMDGVSVAWYAGDALLKQADKKDKKEASLNFAKTEAKSAASAKLEWLLENGVDQDEAISKASESLDEMYIKVRQSSIAEGKKNFERNGEKARSATDELVADFFGGTPTETKTPTPTLVEEEASSGVNLDGE